MVDYQELVEAENKEEARKKFLDMELKPSDSTGFEIESIEQQSI